jgi:hypothetical protein
MVVHYLSFGLKVRFNAVAGLAKRLKDIPLKCRASYPSPREYVVNVLGLGHNAFGKATLTQWLSG